LDLNFHGTETTYAFWMQLGNGAQMSTTALPKPVWQLISVGGFNQGFITAEGFGYVVNGCGDQLFTAAAHNRSACTSS